MTISLNGPQILMVTSTTFALIGMYLYYRKNKYSIPTKWEEIGTVSKLIIYPLKSGKRIDLLEAECTTFGLRDTNSMFQLRDRSLIIFTSTDHEFRTARTYPNMMLISVTVKDKDHLLLNAPNMSSLCFEIPFNSSLIVEEAAKQTKISYFSGEILTTYDCGDEVAKWVSQYLLNKESGLRLGYNDGRYSRDITKAHKELLNYYKHVSNSSTGMYSDLSSVLLVNQKSVDDLNTKVVHLNDGPEITTNNFRPNIVVDGHDLKPYLEDDWDWIKIGDVVFRNVKECVRCTMTTIDPETGSRSKVREPLKTLNQYRVTKGPEKGPIMGIYLEMKKTGGFLSIGDKGPAKFTKSYMCRYCYQTDHWEHRCEIKGNCNSVASPRLTYNTNCTVYGDILCLGHRTFKKKLKCNWTGGYRWSTALALSITLGGFGADRFYLGHWQEGIGKLFSFGGLGVWTIIDVMLISLHYLGPADGSLYI